MKSLTWSARAIPIDTSLQDTGDYGGIAFDPLDPRAKEPLVELRALGIAGENHYARTDGRNAPYNGRVPGSIDSLLARQCVAAMLSRANECLRHNGLELFVHDAYRPIECQQGLWLFYTDRIRRQHPRAAEDQIRREVERYVSNPSRFRPDDASTWPAHSTGGAIDLGLRRHGARELLPMGSAFDEMIPAARTDYYERLRVTGKIRDDDACLINRRILYWAMVEQGFTNYPFEYWHFDFGNQMHIMRLRNQHDAVSAVPLRAWYGYIPQPAA